MERGGGSVQGEGDRDRASLTAAGGSAGSASRSFQADGDRRGWREPAPHEQMGGPWLVGRHVRVYWEADDRCGLRAPCAPCSAVPPLWRKRRAAIAAFC